MRCVVQRVKSSQVAVNGAIVGKIEAGLNLLVGITAGDDDSDIEWLAKKVTGLRLWDAEKPWQKSVVELDYSILAVSQFTLYAVTHKGSKPDFHNALGGEKSEPMFNKFVEKLKEIYAPEKIQTGQFGAMMQVDIVNDGPVTIYLDTKDKKR